MLELVDPHPHRIAILVARRVVGHEPGAVVVCPDRDRLGGCCYYRRTGRDVLGHDGIRPDLRALPDLDRAEDLRAGADDDARTDSRVPLSGDSGRRVRTAQRDVLVDRDVVADFRGFADDAEAVIEEGPLPDPGAGMDVDRRQEAREMVDQPGEEIEPSVPEPVREAMEAKSPHSGIKEHVPARARRRIPRLYRIEIRRKSGVQAAVLPIVVATI